MPPPVDAMQPSAQWVGTIKTEGAWSCQVQIMFSPKLQSKYRKKSEQIKLYNFSNQAEAAAAVDLLAIWRQHILGKPLTARQYNLGLERYSKQRAGLLTCKTAEEVGEHVRRLKDDGTMAKLVEDVPLGSDDGPNGSEASAEQEQARAAAGLALLATGSSGKKRKKGGCGGGRMGNRRAADTIAEEKEEQGGQEEEDEENDTPPPAKKGRKGEAPGAAARCRGSGGTSYHSIIKTGSSWACQVFVAMPSMQTKYQQAVKVPGTKVNLRLASFRTPAEAAAAADLCLLWRCMVYGRNADDVALNFGQERYNRGRGAQLNKAIQTLSNCEEVKELLRVARDRGAFAALLTDAVGRAAQISSSNDSDGGDEGEDAGGCGGSRAPGRGRGGRGGRGRGAKQQAQQEKPSPGASFWTARDEPEPVARGAQGGRGGDDVAAAAAAATAEALPPSGRRCAEEVVGARLRVYWPTLKQWHPGIVTAFKSREGKHEIQYDDGDEGLLDLAMEAVQWIRDDEEEAESRSGSEEDDQQQQQQPRPAAPPPARQRRQDVATAAGPLSASAILRRAKGVRESNEEMCAMLQEALSATPGMQEGDVLAFLARFAALPDLKCLVYATVMQHHHGGRHDLVRTYAWHLTS